MKKLLSILLAVCLFVIPVFSVNAFASESTGVVITTNGGNRDIVLVLDASGSMRNTPIVKMKEAAIKFCESVLNAEGNNRVAIVAYSTNVSSTLDFTDDLDELKNTINKLTANGGTNIYAGFQKAKELLDSNAEPGGIQNIILLTDGIPENGVYETNGRYNGKGPSYSTRYGNALYTYFNDTLKDSYNVYTLGFFHSLRGTSLTYAQALLNDIQNKGYFEVTNVEDLVFTFENIAEEIVSDDDNEIVQNSDTSYTYISNSIEVTINITSQYDDKFNMDVVITNKSGETIHDWIVAYDSSDKIDYIWNGVVLENGEATIIKNAGYNQDIAPNQSVSFGYIATKGDVVQIPTAFRLINEYTTTSEVTYDVECRIDSDWGFGYNGSILINNPSDQAIEDWVMEFDFAETINNMWGAEIVSCEDGHYVIRGAIENHNIQPGSVVTVGFNVSERISQELPSGYAIQSVTQKNN